jgi:hypothetical protein
LSFNTIRSEGSLISADLLDQIHSGEASGQKSTDFGLDGKIRIIDEIAACWSDAKAYWEAFRNREIGTHPILFDIQDHNK